MFFRELPFPYKEINHDEGGLDRKWKYIPTFEFKLSNAEIGLELRLVQYEGKATNILAQVVNLQWRTDGILNPRTWIPKQEHTYYDGPHCFYRFGPFAMYRHWGGCEKCYGNR